MTKEQEERVRVLRAELALLGFVVNTEAFWEVAAEAIRHVARCKKDE